MMGGLGRTALATCLEVQLDLGDVLRSEGRHVIGHLEDLWH
jgi:hypothetical protein